MMKLPERSEVIWDKWSKLVFKNMTKLPERSKGNFFMFLKTNEGCLYQIALKSTQLIVNYAFHEPTFIVSYLQAFPSTFRS